ncbi:hypothetical protein Taro_006981 [Colocasia esculenta]|uniref:Phytocyanin domain-containing protein n=1 Tax=Colocasia esculenta TaxID=4460 RepID=A0A843TTX0_COLES|nr:hypothetical protein [Colocasia esculenta]
MSRVGRVLQLAVVATAAVVLLLPWAATATDYKVGDDDGWRPSYNYTAWATGKDFRVGDTLAFVYTKGKHNVLNVTGDDFKNCTASSNSLLRDSGNDVITLKTEGKKWYICGVRDHCSKQQKLVIEVLQTGTPAGPSGGPAPALAGLAAAAAAALVAAMAVL